MPAGFVQAGERYDRFDFVGAHSTDGKTVMHVGLLTSGVTGGPALEVDVFEVGPPPRLGPGDGKTGKMKAHVVAWGALTPEQRSGIERTLERPSPRSPFERERTLCRRTSRYLQSARS